MLDPRYRQFFDDELEQVLEELPEPARRLLDEIPLYVEDFPSPQVMQKMGIRRRTDLMGLYTGIPLTQRQLEGPAAMSDVVYLYREGILAMSTMAGGDIHLPTLREQMRTTILHELGHHHGMDEDELEELGY